jgi:hypothetical protein
MATAVRGGRRRERDKGLAKSRATARMQSTQSAAGAAPPVAVPARALGAAEGEAAAPEPIPEAADGTAPEPRPPGAAGDDPGLGGKKAPRRAAAVVIPPLDQQFRPPIQGHASAPGVIEQVRY